MLLIFLKEKFLQSRIKRSSLREDVLQSSKKTSQASERLRARGVQELRAELLRALRALKLRATASPEPAVSGIASSSEPQQLCCLWATESTFERLGSEEF